VVPLTSDVGAEANTVTKGDWNDFSWSTTDEPHATRRKIILEKHPEIRSLFVKEPRTFWMTLSLVCIQLTLAYKLQDASYWLILPLAYVIGGTINHSLQLAVHELSHNLCWESQIANKFTAMLANIPTGFPSCITFQRYHMDHHQYQGVDGIDTDIPHWFEVNYFTNTIAKALWIALQPFCYALRPSAIRPKSFYQVGTY
jgi:sphingolipid delta-4 desaturase